eukprot:scaffold17606_cov225-Isochrysis_galbana.AAC.2
MTTRHMRARMDVMTDGCRCTGASPGSLGRPWYPLRASTRVVSFLGRGLALFSSVCRCGRFPPVGVGGFAFDGVPSLAEPRTARGPATVPDGDG